MLVRKIILDNRLDAETYWPGGSLLKIRGQREQCCIGIALTACGLPDEKLEDLGFPEHINNHFTVDSKEQFYIDAWNSSPSLKQWRELKELLSPLMEKHGYPRSFFDFFDHCSNWTRIASSINDSIGIGYMPLGPEMLKVFLPYFAERTMGETWVVEFIPNKKDSTNE